MSQTYQDTLYDSIIDKSNNPQQFLEQFSRYYNFSISFSVGDNHQDIKLPFNCRIDLILLSQTISHQAVGITKKCSKRIASEEMVGKLVRMSGKFQKYADSILKQTGDSMIVDSSPDNFVSMQKMGDMMPSQVIQPNLSIINKEDSMSVEQFLEKNDVLPKQMGVDE